MSAATPSATPSPILPPVERPVEGLGVVEGSAEAVEDEGEVVAGVDAEAVGLVFALAPGLVTVTCFSYT